MSINIKTPQEIEIMHEGGRKLGKVRDALAEAVDAGVSAWEIEELAQELIKKEGAEPSFSKVPGYSWATCVNINEGVVHGIPKKEMVFKKGDVVSVDVGLYYKGFHTDTSTSVVVGEDKGKEKMLDIGKLALKRAIEQARVENKVSDISQALQSVIEDAGLNVIQALTGHGIGKRLHEDPYIPCFVTPKMISASPTIEEGMVFAIEIMYTQGGPEVETGPDGWTIVTQDGKISALFEETVAVTQNGPLILTREEKA